MSQRQLALRHCKREWRMGRTSSAQGHDNNNTQADERSLPMTQHVPDRNTFVTKWTFYIQRRQKTEHCAMFWRSRRRARQRRNAIGTVVHPSPFPKRVVAVSCPFHSNLPTQICTHTHTERPIPSSVNSPTTRAERISCASGLEFGTGPALQLSPTGPEQMPVLRRGKGLSPVHHDIVQFNPPPAA